MEADTYAIGDLQGCRNALERLLKAIGCASDHCESQKQPTIWLTGDLVNRGPDSLGALRMVRALGDRAVTVLGNHDLHLLAVAAGLRRPHRGDTINSILSAPDREDLLEWLRHRPLAHFTDGHLLVHAGVLPSWDATQTLELANEVEAALRGPDWRAFLASIDGNLPDQWSPTLRGPDRLRLVTNALTRMRFTTIDGRMEFNSKDAVSAAPVGCIPWFDLPQRRTQDVTLVCGHWSTLGLLQRANLIALDTGCVWGRSLTAVHLGNRQLIQVDCGDER